MPRRAFAQLSSLAACREALPHVTPTCCARARATMMVVALSFLSLLIGPATASSSPLLPLLLPAGGCRFSEHTPNVEWSGPSLAHGLVGNGSDAACEAWCCAAARCVAWSNLLDADCHLQPGQRCCMGWPAGEGDVELHSDSRGISLMSTQFRLHLHS